MYVGKSSSDIYLCNEDKLFGNLINCPYHGFSKWAIWPLGGHRRFYGAHAIIDYYGGGILKLMIRT